MYSQDTPFSSSSPLLSTSHSKTNSYQLHTAIHNNLLQLHLKSTPSYKTYHRYRLCIAFEGLDESLREKFQNLKNIQAFLNQPNNINVELENGVIQLVICVNLNNGKEIKSKLGEFRLREEVFDIGKCLERIGGLVEARVDGGDKARDEKGWVGDVVKDFVGLFKVLFKRVQRVEEKGNNKEMLNFRNNLGFNSKFGTNSLENTIKSDKIVSRRKHSSFGQQGQPLSNQRPQKIFKNNVQYQSQQIEHWKKQIATKISKMTLKSQQNCIEFDGKLLQLKKQLLSQISSLRKQMHENQVQQFQGLTFHSTASARLGRSPAKTKLMHAKNKLHKQKQQLDCPLPLSLNSSLSTTIVQQKLKKLQSQLHDYSTKFSQFRQIITKKIQNLGNAHQLYEDKLKKMIQQLDLKTEQRLLSQHSALLRTTIIDTSTPFFSQFELQNCSIEYKGEDSQNTMLLSRIPLSVTPHYSIKILKTLVSNIQIGLVDIKYRLMRDCLSHPNFILYVGWSSTIYEGPNDMKYKEGTAIKEGDTVKVKVEGDGVQWWVGGELRARYVSQKLRDRSIEWVPMVRFYDRGDVIQWIVK